MELSLDGEPIIQSPDWQSLLELDVTRRMRPEGNLLHLEARNLGGPAALMLLIKVTYADGTQETIGTDDSWEISDGTHAAKAQSFGKVANTLPWGWMTLETTKLPDL